MLHASKLVAMQRLQHAARSYTHHAGGQIDAAKFAALEAKFHRAYGVNDSPSAKTRAKKKGFAVAELIAWQASPSRVHWWLLATKGKGRVWEFEQLHEIQKTRLQIFGGYELVHDGRTWSWKYLESHIQGLRTSIHLAIAHKQDQRLQSLIADVYATAGFRLARQQAGHLAAFIRADWIRVRGAKEPMPPFPTRMLYVRALPNQPAVAERATPATKPPPPKPEAAAAVASPEQGVAGTGSEPFREIRNASEPVVPAAQARAEMDWLAQLIEEDDRAQKS